MFVLLLLIYLRVSPGPVSKCLNLIEEVLLRHSLIEWVTFPLYSRPDSVLFLVQSYTILLVDSEWRINSCRLNISTRVNYAVEQYCAAVLPPVLRCPAMIHPLIYFVNCRAHSHGQSWDCSENYFRIWKEGDLIYVAISSLKENDMLLKFEYNL